MINTLLASALTLATLRATTPAPWKDGDPNSWSMQRHRELLHNVTNDAIKGGAKVVFLGDSITHFWNGRGKAAWDKYFANGPRKALNLGIGGDRTEHVLWRITEGKELDGYEAKVIALMIGTNNIGHFLPCDETPIDTILGIRRVLDVILEKQPKARIILTAIFPREHEDKAENCQRRIDIVNREIQRFADGKRIIWCDFTEKFVDANGRMSPELFPDLLHPGPLGYEIWASSIIPTIDRCLAADEGEFIPSVWPSRPRLYSTEPSEALRASSCIAERDWWLPRLLAKRTEISESNGEFDIVMIGDSITHGWESAGKESLAELRKTYSVLNLGYSADRTQHVLWRCENGELDGYRAKCIMLMVGTNNPQGTDSRTPVSDVADGIRAILRTIARKQPQAKVVLLPIFPRSDKTKNVRNQKVNDIIRYFADGKRVFWCDFNAKFADADGDLKWAMPDGLHPNAASYRDIWLPSVLSSFKNAISQ